MRSDIIKVLDRCDVCARLHTAVGYRPLKPIDCHYLFDLVFLDTAEVVFPGGHKEYFLVAVDHFTCWVEIKWIGKQTS